MSLFTTGVGLSPETHQLQDCVHCDLSIDHHINLQMSFTVFLTISDTLQHFHPHSSLRSADLYPHLHLSSHRPPVSPCIFRFEHTSLSISVARNGG